MVEFDTVTDVIDSDGSNSQNVVGVGGELRIETVIRSENVADGTVRRRSVTLFLTLNGEFGYGTADRVSELVGRHLGAPHSVSSVSLCSNGVEFCDSYGIAQLVRIRRMTARAGASLALVQPSRQLRRVLEVTGLLEMLGASSGPVSDPSTTAELWA